MATSREERLALNEALFRTANERMARWEERHSEQETELYHCECSELECRTKVRLAEADYERIRTDSRQFVIAPGHQVPTIETVIEAHDDWAIVEKCSEVQELVEQTDPRQP